MRPSGLDTVFRLQGSQGPFIVGVSHIRTLPYQVGRFVAGNTVFTGVDARWMYAGVQLRSEWITGQSFDGVTTKGWYVDGFVHRLAMGPVTAVARIEQLDYDTPVTAFQLHARRQTIGARVRLFDGLSVQANLMHHTGRLAAYHDGALDLSVTYSVRRDLQPPLMPEAAPQTIPWHRRLEARVVAGVGLLVAGSLGAVLVVTTRAVTDSSLARASDELQAARAGFYRLVDDRAEFASAEAALVTALPVFRAHMTDTRLAEDAATLGAMADDYRRQLKADFCVVTDRDGRWTAQSGWPETARSAPARSARRLRRRRPDDRRATSSRWAIACFWSSPSPRVSRKKSWGL